MTSVARLERLLAGEDLSRGEASESLHFLLHEETNDVERAGLLTAWRAKGATGQELAGLVDVAVATMEAVDFGCTDLVDTCGTGGGPSTLNLSTGAAVVAAAAGVKMAKHGNRSVSSRVGSADVIEAWGVPLGESVAATRERFDRAGIAFLFAPHHHAAFRAVGPARKGLGVRTVFNLVGPLSNPANAPRRLIGVYGEALLDPMAEALVALGAEEAYVVFGHDGLDEVSPSAATSFRHVVRGTIQSGTWQPADFGMEAVPTECYLGRETATEGAAALMEAITGGRGAEALIPNVAVTLLLAGMASDSASAGRRARDVIASGEAENVVNRLRGDSR